MGVWGNRGVRSLAGRSIGLFASGALLATGALLAVAASSPGAAGAANPNPLIGEWHLDDLGTDNMTATDSSGAGNDLTIENAINDPRIAGKFGDAYSFTGSLDLRRDGVALQPAQLTVLAWVKSTGSPPADNGYVIAEGGDACNGASYALRVGGGGGLQFYVWGGPSVSVSPSAESSAGVWDGNWHAVAGTYDGTSVHLYVDGTEIGSAMPGPVGGIDYGLSGQDFTIGTFPDACPNTNFSGAVDEARVYDEALTPTQIHQLQTATGPDPPVLGGGTTTTTTTTPPPPPPPPPVARLAAATGTAGKPVLINAAGSSFPGRPVASYRFQLGDDSSQVTCPGQDPVLSAIVTKSVSSATHVTVTVAGGATSTASSSIFVAPAPTIPTVKLTKITPKKGHISASGGTPLGQVPVLASECLPAGGNTAKMAKAPRVGAVKAASQAPTTSSGGTPGCADQVEIGIVQGLGCFQLVDAGHPLPQAEANILCQYQYACTGLKANSTLYKILEGRGASEAAGFSAGPVGADVIYYSTQPVRIDGLEVDPVNGGAIVVAVAGALSSDSTFIVKDSAYLISSDAVVKVGDLPVSLHIPDYQAAYQNASAALNKGQAAYNNASSLNPVNLSDINIPNPTHLIPSTDGPINLAVSSSKVGEELGEFEVPGKILPIDDLPKLPLTGSVKVNLLANGGAAVAVHVALPDVLSDGNGHGLTGDTTLSIDNTNGLELNNLHILIPSASDVGSAGLKSLELTYSRQPQVFDGKMVLDLGYATVGGELRLENGDFKSASLSYQADQGQGIAIYPPVYLVALSGSLSLNPTTISSTSQISIGPAASTGCGPVGITGTTSVSFGNPVAFDTSGAFALNCGNYGYNAGLHFDSDGNVAGRVGIGYSIPNIAKVGGELELQAYTDLKNIFIAQVDGKLQAVVTVHECEGPVCGDSGPINVDAQAVISLGTNNRHAVGTAGLCVNVKLLGVGFSVGAGTSDLPSLLAIGVGQGSFSDVASHFSILFDGCNISTWQLLKPTAGFAADRGPRAGLVAASGSGRYPITVAPATKTAVIGVTGSGGAPMVQISGPGGKTIEAATPDGISEVGGALVVRDPQTDETLVEIPHPAAGGWHVTSAPGSAPIQAVRQAHTLPAPVIRAHVTGRGATRTLHYAVMPQPGLKVTFLEGVGRGVNLIGNAKHSHGTLRFAPGLGSSKPRTIEARIVRNGQPFGTLVVAHWSPGRLAPGRVTHLKVTHSRRGTRVSFDPAPLALTHQVTIRFADGQELLEIVPRGKHTVTVGSRVDATIPTAVGAVGVRGTTRGPLTILDARRPH